MAKMKALFTSVNLYRENENPIFGNSVTKISLNDEAAGMFIEIEQCTDSNEGKIRIDVDEIESIKSWLDYFARLINDYESEQIIGE